MFETINLRIAIYLGKDLMIDTVYSNFKYGIDVVIDDYLDHIADTNELYGRAEYGPVAHEVVDSLISQGFHSETIAGVRHLIEVIK